MRTDFQSANTLIVELKETVETFKREKITIEREIRITKEKYIKEIRQKDAQISKVSFFQYINFVIINIQM